MAHIQSPEPLRQLAESRLYIIARASAGQLDPGALHSVADIEASLTLLLYPMPLDPVAHVRAAHAWSRPFLERLVDHDAATEISLSDGEGFTYVFTPRKVLRRVLDHALDHLNQIEQWVAWQERGLAPIPADGWVGSSVTLAEDLLSLSSSDLDAWLWRIDLAVEMLATRATQLDGSQLDWVPPDGGWTLRQVLHHEATAERFYVVWLDEPLPEDPVARYKEASDRVRVTLHRAFDRPLDEGTAYIDGEAMRCSVEGVIARIQTAEQHLQVSSGST